MSSDAPAPQVVSSPVEENRPSLYPPSELEELRVAIARAATLLPAQGPITAFVFLNPLEGLEHLPFDEGLERGAALFQSQPYLSEDEYRAHLSSGRIALADVETALAADLGADGAKPVIGRTTRYELRHTMLTTRLRVGRPIELRWFVAETDALNQFRSEATAASREEILTETRRWALHSFGNGATSVLIDEQTRLEEIFADLPERFGRSRMGDWAEETWTRFTLQALWRMCRAGVLWVGLPSPETASPRLRDLLLEETGVDVDLTIHATLVRFCAAFTDQGFARSELPHRDVGLFHAFCDLYSSGFGPPDRLLRGLGDTLRNQNTRGLTPLESIRESLDALGIPRDEWSDRITAKLVALKGWAGLIHQMDVRADRVARPVPTDSLVEFVAIRMLLERVTCFNLAAERLGSRTDLRKVRTQLLQRRNQERAIEIEPCAFEIYQLAQLLGWSAGELFALTREDWRQLVAEVDGFRELDRRKILHHAYETRFRSRALDAVAVHARRPIAPASSSRPRFQAAFCIDTREESLRRYIEEVAPDAETFGVAGFFGVPIYFRGISEANFSTLCPIVIRPKHWVLEEPTYLFEQEHQRRARARQVIGTATHRFHLSSRNAAGAALLTFGFGVLATIPLVFRVLFPRMTAQIRKRATRFVQAPQLTRLRLERAAEHPGPEISRIGFTLDEMAAFSARTLRDMGLTRNLSRLVFFFGHGSACLNNPHKSAYDCGACSGGMGGPNARAIAMMLNDLRVRERIAADGHVEIPEDTLFMGCLHNTCNDTFTYYDLDLLPMSHRSEFEAARESLEQAAMLNAQERCRRFESAPLTLPAQAAHRHVEGRAEDLAQTRPEYGNSTNAMAFVGRRTRTRGLYLDRRSFLVSYDPVQDDGEYTTLGRILSAVVPVCTGINLQYYFSRVDSTGWGCGSKLPHNVTSLLGVMDGAASDLRTGLPWQGVDIHEPMRCLFVIEAPPMAIEKIMARNEQVRRILANGWVQLALLDPQSDAILHYKAGQFVPFEPSIHQLPQVQRSRQWYRGNRDHLDFCELTG